MIGQDSSAKAPRVAALVLAALALGATALAFIGTLNRPSNDFATMYAAARAVADNRAANVYDFSTLAQINATHHYASEALFPFSYPPFTLLALRPLTPLPFDAARVVWIVIVYAALLGTATLLVDTFVRLLRQPQSASDTQARALIESTSQRIGKWDFPILPFAITTAALLLTLPLFDADYWGQATILVVLLLALTLNAATRGAYWLAGAAAGVAAGFAGWQPIVGISALAVLAFLAFLLQGYWKALVAGIGAVALVTLLAFIATSPDAYAAFGSQSAFLGGVYLTNGHNISLAGMIANVLTISEHTLTSNFLQGARLAQSLDWVFAILAILVAVAASLSRWWRERSAEPQRLERPLHLPLFALLLVTPALVAPLVWPAEAMMTPFAALILLGYVFVQDRMSRFRWLAGAAAALALLCCAVAVLSGADLRNLPQGEVILTFYLLRPLAALLVWLGALAILAGDAVSELRGLRGSSRAIQASAASFETTTQA